MAMSGQVTTIRLPASDVHVVAGPHGTVLGDAGTRAAVPRLDAHRLGAVVLTHGHADR